MPEIRYRKHFQYINDLAGYTKKTPVAVFDFTLEELYALDSWIPMSDTFHKDILEAINELEKLHNAKSYESQIDIPA